MGNTSHGIGEYLPITVAMHMTITAVSNLGPASTVASMTRRRPLGSSSRKGGHETIDGAWLEEYGPFDGEGARSVQDNDRSKASGQALCVSHQRLGLDLSPAAAGVLTCLPNARAAGPGPWSPHVSRRKKGGLRHCQVNKGEIQYERSGGS